MKLEYIVVALFLIAVILLITQFTLYQKLTGRLKSNHHATWVELGSPTLGLGNSIQSAMNMQKFLGREEYQKLDDPRVTKLGKMAKAVTWAYYGLFGILLLLVVLLILKGTPTPQP